MSKVTQPQFEMTSEGEQVVLDGIRPLIPASID